MYIFAHVYEPVMSLIMPRVMVVKTGAGCAAKTLMPPTPAQVLLGTITLFVYFHSLQPELTAA